MKPYRYMLLYKQITEASMKKFLLAISLTILFSVSSFAAEIGEMYISPVLGYHFFDKNHELDDNAEAGLRLGYFFMNDHSVELEGDYTNTDYDRGGNKNATSLSLTVAKFFDFNDYYKPYMFLGAGGLFHEDSMSSLVGGIGARIITSENLSFDFRLKDMYHSKGRNDIIPSISLNYHFGKTSKMPVYEKAAEEPAPKAAEKEEAKPAAAVEKKAESKAMAKAPVDTDGDGVYDSADRCPGTPAGLAVDSFGCLPDTDGDGVYDFEDKCPDTMKGVKVNSAGCFVKATLLVNFKTNSSEIDEKYLDNLQNFAKFLKVNKTIRVEIQGHADSRGTNDYNMALSKQRAESVAKILTDRYGISSDRVSAIGYGENMPLVPNDSPENMMKNRRIETVVK